MQLCTCCNKALEVAETLSWSDTWIQSLRKATRKYPETHNALCPFLISSDLSYTCKNATADIRKAINTTSVKKVVA
eukprot:2760042-Amphidinium_carterae.1